MKRYTQPVYDDQLSAAPCTGKMKEDVIKVARKENISVAEIVRRGVSLFLSQNYSEAIDNDSEAIERAI